MEQDIPAVRKEQPPEKIAPQNEGALSNGGGVEKLSHFPNDLFRHSEAADQQATHQAKEPPDEEMW
jgi:hypothetical protein